MSAIEMIPIQSSRIESIGYEESTSTLRVGLRNGSLHAYENVSKFEYRQLSNSPSVEEYFDRNIKGKYASHRIC